MKTYTYSEDYIDSLWRECIMCLIYMTEDFIEPARNTSVEFTVRGAQSTGDEDVDLRWHFWLPIDRAYDRACILAEADASAPDCADVIILQLSSELEILLASSSVRA